jgi:hypothetical protein
MFFSTASPVGRAGSGGLVVHGVVGGHGGPGLKATVPSRVEISGDLIVVLGISLPEDGYPVPNENLDWRQASGGMAAFAKYVENLARRQHCVTFIY